MSCASCFSASGRVGWAEGTGADNSSAKEITGALIFGMRDFCMGGTGPQADGSDAELIRQNHRQRRKVAATSIGVGGSGMRYRAGNDGALEARLEAIEIEIDDGRG